MRLDTMREGVPHTDRQRDVLPDVRVSGGLKTRE
jgi:hypothetical protein